MDRIEEIKKNVAEMKRMRKSLRKQLDSLFDEIAEYCKEQEATFTFTYKDRTFGIQKIEYGVQPGQVFGVEYEFVEIVADWPSYNKGFTDGYNCWVNMKGFSNDDVIFLARNIDGILDAMNGKLQGEIASLIQKRPQSFKVFDVAEVGGKRFAILVNDKTKEAYEAVEINGEWEIDFDYPSIGIDSFDVAGALDFEGTRTAGYKFSEDK